MTRIRLPEVGYERHALFAVELLDAVTLDRVTQGVAVVAEGLTGAPRINSSGLFTWRDEDLTPLRQVSIDPGTLPFERRTIPRADLRLPPASNPITTIELAPLASYPLAAGITAVRGTLIEDRTQPRVPVAGAEIGLRWLDEDGATWRDAPAISTTTAGGDFLSVLRLSPADVPLLDAAGALTVRVRARRGGATRVSADLKLPQGRVADPTTLSALILAWDELQP